MDEELDLLSEIVTHPGWRVLRRELDATLRGLQSQVLTPSESEFDLVKKEALTVGMRTLTQFFAGIQERTEKYNRTVKRRT